MNSSEIDAVVTWVDGNDPRHIERRQATQKKCQKLDIKYTPSGRSTIRFTDNNEVEYCLRGIRKFMPWVRTIFLVTDEQRPRFLTEELRLRLGVQVVDHRHIFAGHEGALPTFNSISIGTVLHRIPGLAPKYIYLNDDVIPVAPSVPENFFIHAGVVVRGKWINERTTHPPTALMAAALRMANFLSRKDRSAHVLAQMHAARMAGFRDRYYKSFHAPHPVRTETLRGYFQRHPIEFERNIKYPFRNLDQFVAHPLAHHLEAAMGTLVPHDGSDCITLSFGNSSDTEKNLPRLANSTTKFICLQSLELATDNTKEAVLEFLNGRIMNSISASEF